MPAVILLKGDCLQLMPLPCAVHAVITDPPYNIGKWGVEWKADKATSRQAVKLKAAGQAFRPEQYAELQTFTLGWASRLNIVPGGFVVVFSQPRLAGAVMSGMVEANLHIRDMLVWNYPRGQMKAQDLSRYAPGVDMQGRKTAQFAPEYEAIIVAQSPLDGKLVENWAKHQTGLVQATYPDGSARGQLLRHNKPQKDERNSHPTQKPEALMRDLIERFTLEGQIVLDPFAGSGSTLAAAKSCARRAIGIEKDAAFLELAKQRLSSREESLN